eukprot:TRINITY_DN312_c0_g2_i2.p1 TRINITY_DN312_c0_g2~~TRINITY_DN312_c0_g2_i2.p1  ORF type:complete len:139 (-),score=2.43 TRINITY_DN312_c0_g2_i2:22-438(-)
MLCVWRLPRSVVPNIDIGDAYAKDACRVEILRCVGMRVAAAHARVVRSIELERERMERELARERQLQREIEAERARLANGRGIVCLGCKKLLLQYPGVNFTGAHRLSIGSPSFVECAFCHTTTPISAAATTSLGIIIR